MRYPLRPFVLLAIVGGLLALLCDPAVAQEAAGLGSVVSGVLDDPTYGWLVRSLATAMLVVAITEGVRRRFRKLRDDSDGSALVLIGVALGSALALGGLGLAPATPIGGHVGGGFACWLVSIAGVQAVKKVLGFREERAEAKRATDPGLRPVPGEPAP